MRRKRPKQGVRLGFRKRPELWASILVGATQAKMWKYRQALDQQNASKRNKKWSVIHFFLQSKDLHRFSAFKKYRNQWNAELKIAKIWYYKLLFSNKINDGKKSCNEIIDRRCGHKPWDCLNIMTTIGLKTGNEALWSLKRHFGTAIVPDERRDESDSLISSVSQIVILWLGSRLHLIKSAKLLRISKTMLHLVLMT